MPVNVFKCRNKKASSFWYLSSMPGRTSMFIFGGGFGLFSILFVLYLARKHASTFSCLEYRWTSYCSFLSQWTIHSFVSFCLFLYIKLRWRRLANGQGIESLLVHFSNCEKKMIANLFFACNVSNSWSKILQTAQLFS